MTKNSEERKLALSLQLERIELHNRAVFMKKMILLNKKLRNRNMEFFEKIRYIQRRIFSESLLIDKNEQEKLFNKLNEINTWLKLKDDVKEQDK